MSWAALALILGAAGLYALSKDKRRCPYCGAFVSNQARRCSKCNFHFYLPNYSLY